VVLSRAELTADKKEERREGGIKDEKLRERERKREREARERERERRERLDFLELPLLC
jgi:hypothetical protein